MKILVITLASWVLISFADIGKAASASPATDASNTTLATTPHQVVDKGANYQVWQWQTFEPLANGQTLTHNHSITELASGLNYQNANGQWMPAQEHIVPYAQGAIAQQSQHQVIFANNLNASGAIDEQTPDGKRLVSNILGLMYYDPTTGQSVQIAQIQDTEGQLVANNQVLYTNAFEGMDADVLLTYRRDGMEQDVILRKQPPAPQVYGLNPATVELEIVTEFINPPDAKVWDLAIDPQESEPDQAVSWGATSLGRGRAFSLNGNDVPVVIRKRYVEINGHFYLLEKVSLQQIQPALQTLPLQASNARRLPGMASKHPTMPRSPNPKTAGRPIHFALNNLEHKGYVLDYTSLNAAYTNFTFQGDTTYYVSGNINLSGTNTFEGGTVVKYAPNGAINISAGGTVTVLAKPYCPAILTAVDDNTVGEGFGSGSPSGYYANPALNIGSLTGTSLSKFRISYANRGISVSGASPSISDAQFVSCATALADINGQVNLANVLFSNIKTNFNTAGTTNVISVQNTTFNNGFDVVNGNPASSLILLTNCVLANVTNLSGSLSAGYNGFYRSPMAGATAMTNAFYPFQTVGAASCYLTNTCAFINAGTNNIAPNTLISQDFVGQVKGGITGESVFSILGLPTGPSPFKKIGQKLGRIFPDLVDVPHKEIYEIKPMSFAGTAKGAIQLALYIKLFNKLDPTGGVAHW